MTFELTDILATHLTTMVFMYGSTALLLANLAGMLTLSRLERKRPSSALVRAAALTVIQTSERF